MFLPKEDEERLHTLSDDSIAAYGFRWMQGLENVTVVLSGMSTMEQMVENCQIFDEAKPLNEQEYDALMDAAEHLKNSIPCTACRYCCDGCPMGLNIPDLIAKYNQLKTGVGSTVKMQLDALPEDKLPSACIACGACAAICPQKIAIPEELAAFSNELAKLPSWAEICRQREEAARRAKEAS